MNTGTALTPTPRSPKTWGERLQKLHIDLWLLTLLLSIASIGLITLYSASGHSLSSILAQAQRLLLGLAVMTALAQVPPDYYRAAAPWFYGVALLLLVQAAQLVLSLILPGVAGILGLASIVLFLWLTVQFTKALHGFRSSAKVALGLIGTAFVAGFVLSLIAALIARWL